MSQVLSTDLPPYLSRLDEAQRRAALDTEGYVAIYAGAGQGSLLFWPPG